MTCSFATHESVNRSCPLNEYSIERFANDAYRILKQFNKSPSTSNAYSPAITYLGMSAGKFLEGVKTKSIADLFSKQSTKSETLTSTGNTIHWQEIDDEDEGSEKEEIVLEKPTTTALPIQGDFFRKFQKSEEQLVTPSKSEVKPTSSITSFFSRYTTNENLSNPSSDEFDDRYVTCPKCQKPILSWTMSEHEDFHYARELQMEENKRSPIVAPTITKPSKPIKRKIEKNQTLDAFLNKKSKI